MKGLTLLQSMHFFSWLLLAGKCISEAKELEIYKPSGHLICFSTHHSDIVKYRLWHDGRGWQRQLDSSMAVPSYIVQQRQSFRQCLHQQGRPHPSSCLLPCTRLEWCTTCWPILACRYWPWQLRGGTMGKFCRASAPAASHARTLSSGLFPQQTYNKVVLGCFLTTIRPTFTSCFCLAEANLQNDLGQM